MHIEDKMMTANLVRTVLILIGFMCAIIILANLLA
jgi:hypothetical protein